MPGAAPKRSIELQERDAEILRGLFDSRLMTLAHAAALHFEGRHEAAKKRIQKLKAAGLIGERKRKAYEPSVLFLTRDGYRLLNERGHLSAYPTTTWPSLEKRLQVSDLTLRHELEVMDVKAAFGAALQREESYGLVEFSTWPVLFQFRACPGQGPELLIKPDAFVRIQEREGSDAFEHTFFVEVDRSTETLDTLARKALCYLDFYQRGGLAVRNGRPRSEYKEFPFRVLMIFKSEERRNNVAKTLITGNPPIFTQVWLATMEEMISETLGPIWIRPKDCQDIKIQGDFDAQRAGARGPNRRHAGHEITANPKMGKLTLLSADHFAC